MKKILATILATALGLGAWGDASVATQAELNSAISAAAAGDTITITAAGTYTMPSIPRNITIIGGVDGVVFNCAGAYGTSICSVSNGAMLKNVSFTMGNENYHGWQGQGGTLTFENCTFTGKFFSYGNMLFKACTFNQTTGDYNMWVYGPSTVEYLDCTFTNTKGKFLNLYREGSEANVVKIVGCKFINNGESSKAAVNVKATQGTTPLNYKVVIDDCETEGNFPSASESSALVVFDSLLQVDDRNAAVASKIVVAEGTDIVLDESGDIVSGNLTAYYKDDAADSIVAESSELKDNGNGTYTVKDPNASVPVTNSVQSANLFGAIKVTGVASNMFVAVPFEGFEAAGAARKAQDAVHPAGLADGTKMYVYDSAAGKYDVFEVSGNAWAKASKVTVGADGTVSVDDPDLERPLSAGSGVIVDRKSMDAPVYVYGQIPSSSSVRLAAGVSLVCAPSTNALEAVDLNALAWEGVTEAGGNAAGTRVKVIDGKDVIKFRGPDNKMVTYYCLGGKWGPVFRPAGWDGKATVPAGTAFWYTCNNAAGATMAW